MDLEEGEIPNNLGGENAGGNELAGENNSDDGKSVEVQETVGVPETLEHGDTLNGGNHDNYSVGKSCNNSKDVDFNEKVAESGGTEACFDDPNPLSGPIAAGPIELSLPPNCFGSFPSSLPPASFNSHAHRLGDDTNSTSWVKRRKLNKVEIRFSPYRCYTQPRCDSNNFRKEDAPPPLPNSSSLDLNRKPPDINNVNAQFDNEESCSSSTEIERTIAIGADIGFQINRDDPLLVRILGETGEIVGQK
ncbi:hypothetical protein L1887_33237 [Cichorium endivia]|nr:hypothetical protein L1887_33237 [Cichorium endivia]